MTESESRLARRKQSLKGRLNYAQVHVPPLFYGAGLERAWTPYIS